LTEKVLGASHVDRVSDGPKGCGSVPETMQVDAKTEGMTTKRFANIRSDFLAAAPQVESWSTRAPLNLIFAQPRSRNSRPFSCA
jgi:hypothetical protein